MVKASLSDTDALAAAFQGMDFVFGVTNFYDPQILNETLLDAQFGCNMADIARKSGVKLFIWSTVPSALVRSGAKFDGPRLVENKFTVSQYLKAKKVPHCDLYVGFYLENFINFGMLNSTKEGHIEINQACMKPETEIGMVFLEPDLGKTVMAILKTFQTDPDRILNNEFYCVGARTTCEQVLNKIHQHTGKPGRVNTTPTSGLKDLDLMYEYYNKWGVYTEFPIPHEATTATLGVQFSSVDDYVKEVVVPYLQKLG